MSPMKKPKFKVAANSTKNPKTTFSRFIRPPITPNDLLDPAAPNVTKATSQRARSGKPPKPSYSRTGDPGLDPVCWTHVCAPYVIPGERREPAWFRAHRPPLGARRCRLSRVSRRSRVHVADCVRHVERLAPTRRHAGGRQSRCARAGDGDRGGAPLPADSTESGSDLAVEGTHWPSHVGIPETVIARTLGVG